MAKNIQHPATQQIDLDCMERSVYAPTGMLSVGQRVSIRLPGCMMHISGTVIGVKKLPDHKDIEAVLIRTANK